MQKSLTLGMNSITEEKNITWKWLNEKSQVKCGNRSSQSNEHLKLLNKQLAKNLRLNGESNPFDL